MISGLSKMGLAAYKHTKAASLQAVRSNNRGILRSEQKRNLSIHEYQAQHFLREAGVAVPRGRIVTEANLASDVSRELGPCVVKAQILAGGRGKGLFCSGLKSGVHIVESPEEATTITSQMLGKRLRTKQTPADGLLVEKVYITEKVASEKELYLSIAIDRTNRCPTIVASRHGGMDIEAAKSDPTSVIRLPLSYQHGIDAAITERISRAYGLSSDEASLFKIQSLLSKLYAVYQAKDATLLEINPLVLDKSGELICLDSKFSFDDAARYRQPELFALEDKTRLDPDEQKAAEAGFSYVRLDGNIGIIVNGAGLAMATNDAVNHFGGRCANFLDAGGKATKQTMIDAFQILLKDDSVEVMLINIYGGIIHGDMVATSIIGAAKELGRRTVPMVVRLQGTRAEEGQVLLAECGLDIHSVSDFTEAVQLAVKLASREGNGS